MENKHTSNDIKLFFERFKQLPEYFEMEKVHQILHNPHAKATHTVNFNFKHLKFIVMTSIVLTVITAGMLWFLPNKPVDDNFGQKERIVEKPDLMDQPASSENLSTMKVKEHNELSPKKENQMPVELKDNGNDPNLIANANNYSQVPSEESTCNWPIDTVMDKHNLFVYLSNAELEKLGVLKGDNYYYYKNQMPGNKGNVGHCYNCDSEKMTSSTSYPFYLAHSSDTSCTQHRWGHVFYEQIDTLLPVIIDVYDETLILWFTTHAAIFDALPLRYRHLKKVYENLKCIKSKNPGHQIVNYWDKSNNILMDQIPYLLLNEEELNGIGVELFEDSISMMDSSGFFRYHQSRYMLNCGSYIIEGAKAPEIPKMFPALMTDIKGLKQHSYGDWIKGKQQSNTISGEVLNTMIPVLLPISKLIRGKNYDIVMWYYPSPEFLNALPERYRRSIRSEIEYINTGKSGEAVSCTYFEACKATLWVDGMKIYPNPVQHSATVEFEVPQAYEGQLFLVNVAGNRLKTLVSKTAFVKGINRFEVNLSDISPGIYLISIATDQGFKTQRIIVSR